MTETVTILRYTEGTDAYGDPIPGDYLPHLSRLAKVAPHNPAEPVEVGRNAVITGGTVYIRDKERLDIRAEDRVEVHGTVYEINGEVGIWPRSSEFGHQFAYQKQRG